MGVINGNGFYIKFCHSICLFYAIVDKLKILFFEEVEIMSFLKRLKNIIISNINYDKFNGPNFAVFQNFKSKENYEWDSSEHFTEPQNNKTKNVVEEEYYANLELPYGASFDEIKTSYRKLLKKYHPDRFYNDEKKLQLAQEVVIKLNLAYNYFENKFTGS